MSTKTIFIRTAADGTFTYERNFKGVIDGIELIIGTLSTPDIDITDDTYGISFLSLNGVAADAAYYPGNWLMSDAAVPLEDNSTQMAAPAVCMGVLKVAVTGGGNTLKGRVTILYH